MSGHSYVPDLVRDVGTWMGKLPAAMAGPTNAATSATAAAFANLQTDVAGMSIDAPSIDVPDLSGMGGEIDAPSGQASSPAAASGFLATLQRIQTGLQGIGDAGRSAFTEMADSIISAAMPAIEALQSKTATLADKIGAVGNALSTIFGAIFGKKVGRVVGAIGQIGMSFASAFGGIKVPGFAGGGHFACGGSSGLALFR